MKLVYECQNPGCTLGTRDQPGRFTSGISARQLEMLTGAPTDPDVEDPDAPLEGFCPTCGTEGNATGEEHDPHEMVGDPHQPLHDLVDGRVQDPDDPLTRETSQQALLNLVKEANHG